MVYQGLVPVETFGPYTLVQTIGEGGLSSVYLARSETAGEVALKRLHREIGRRPGQAALFEEEGRLASRFTHQNLVHAFETGAIGPDHYIAMELVRGPNLAQMLETKQPTRRGAARVVRDVCAALEHVHEGGIVHCDVTRTNILVDPERAKLTDFGVATPMGEAQLAVRGTWAYMSPEQARGLQVDRRSDVFSVGVILWELLARKRLFRRPEPYLTLAAVVEEPTPLLDDRALNVVVQKALAKDANERYQTCAALADALEDAVGTDSKG
jgi:eukaryotic-like serine/threonine-protein kinase